ncbi:hypothetical protein PPTG_05158 [Phytophthora nicotianae INRA-310]|uniref:Uncharacterized protein n=1 Tax=Phytophthora nicotianae (strain INRA-310) TaxID=761204 RepID=W2QY32_PHYN3|nr:hypothetical protein PPTG_05158 [Phytophthora nicotianae INRA-310]ETN17334.1 hypothetical protein PPTG_05158 [Phytophthora nicotianae INRA-310]
MRGVSLTQENAEEEGKGEPTQDPNVGDPIYDEGWSDATNQRRHDGFVTAADYLLNEASAGCRSSANLRTGRASSAEFSRTPNASARGDGSNAGCRSSANTAAVASAKRNQLPSMIDPVNPFQLQLKRYVATQCYYPLYDSSDLRKEYDFVISRLNFI